MKKLLLTIIILLMAVSILLPNVVIAETADEPDEIDTLIASMSNEEKIAMMIMPSFRRRTGIAINNDNIKEILSTYEYAGVILFGENTPDIESTMRLVDMMQEANKDHHTRLLVAIDQEGGYVARLGVGTTMPGNMALAATGNPKNAYQAGKAIGKELKMLGINTNFAPVVDVNSNPNNPVIGVRSFSDDPNTVATYGEQFMKGLQSEGIVSSLKHFPGHGDTSTDSHTKLDTITKTYEELKSSDLVPFQKLVDAKADMIMTSHISFSNITTERFKKGDEEYSYPATLSSEILNDILRKDMGFEGVIITDALDMGAITNNFELEDASIRAINAGANILLMPFTYDYQKDDLKAFVQSMASKIGTEIDEAKVNDSVRRVLKLKKEKGLFEAYDGSKLESNIAAAKEVVSNKEVHNEEFEIAKQAITMIKNEGNVLPLDGTEKTVILYEYGSHVNAVKNAIAKLVQEGSLTNGDNISLYPFYDDVTGELKVDTIKEQIKDAKNVIMIRSTYSAGNMTDPDLDKMNQLIDFVHEKGGKVVFLSTHLPYDVAKFTKADAIVLTYLANGMSFLLEDYEKELPKYGPNVYAGIYMLFTQKSQLNGTLPVNLYNIDSNNKYTDEIIYKRGTGLKYLDKADLTELNSLMEQVAGIINGKKPYTEDTLNTLKEKYNAAVQFTNDNPKLLVDKQEDINSLANDIKNAINALKVDYRIIDGDNQETNGEAITITANGLLNELVRLDVNGNELDPNNYVLVDGSTKVTLKEEYLKSLKNGTYKLTYVYSDGSVDATFIVNNKAKNNPYSPNNPGTGSMNIYLPLGIILIISFVSVIIFSICGRRKIKD